MIISFLHVALGGAIGAALRYGMVLALARLIPPGFPVAVPAVNILGSFLMGLFAVLSFHRGLEPLNPLVMTGLLGGFTTFSAFSLDAVTLMERGELLSAAGYVLASVGLSIAALLLGMALARSVLA